MRLTVLIVALSLLIIVAEPAVMTDDRDYPEDHASLIEEYASPEGHQSISEVSAISGEQRSSSSVYGISEEYQSLSKEYAKPYVQRSLSSDQGISEGYQSISKEYTMPEAQMPAYEDQGISIKSQSLSKGYALSEKNAVPEEIPSLSGPVSEALPLTAERAQSGAPSALVATLLFALVFFLPALLIATLLICTAALLIFLSPPGMFFSLILGLFFSIPGALILGPLFFVAIFIIALVSGVGVVASPLLISLLCGAAVFLCCSSAISAFALCPTESFALCCGSNAVSLCMSLLFQFIHIAVTWTYFSGGGFGPGMMCYLCTLAFYEPLSLCYTILCSPWSVIGWLGNCFCMGGAFPLFEACVWCLSFCFDIFILLCLPLLDIVSAIGGASGITGIISAGISIFTTIPDVILALGWICCGDFCILCPESWIICITSCCAQLCAPIPGWIAQCVAVAPSASVVIGLFSGLVLALVAVILGFVLSSCPVIGWCLGDLITSCSLALIGGIAGCIVGLFVGPFIPILLVIFLMAAGVAIVIATWLVLAAYLAEATGTSGLFLAMVRRAVSALAASGRFVLEFGRSLMSFMRGILIPIISFIDGCLSTCRYYDDMANLLFVLCYTVLAPCASTGIFSCCIGPCIVVPGMVCNFCAQLSWDFTYSLTDSLRSITSSSLVLLKTGDLGLMNLIYQNAYVLLDFIITSFGHCTDLVAVLVNVWGVIASGIGAVMALVSECAALCSSIDFIGGMPALIISLCEDLPMRICTVLQNCGFLFLTLSGFIIDALSRMRDRFPAPGETL